MTRSWWVAALCMWNTALAGSPDAPIRLSLTPSTMPPTRTVCEVRTPSVTTTVEWNPEDLSPLRQEVLLPPKADETDGPGLTEVQFQCWSAVPPLTHHESAFATTKPYWVFKQVKKHSFAGASLAAGTLTDSTRDEVLKIAESLNKAYESMLETLQGADATKIAIDKLASALHSTTVPDGARASSLYGIGLSQNKLREVPDTRGFSQTDNRRRTYEFLVENAANGAEFLWNCIIASRSGNGYDKNLWDNASCPTNVAGWRREISEHKSETESLMSVLRAGADKITIEASLVLREGHEEIPAELKAPNITVEVRSSPRIDDRLHVLDTRAASATSNRSLANPVPEVVTDTLQILGEIALKRAEARARELIVDQLTSGICDNHLQIESKWVDFGKANLKLNGTKAPSSPYGVAAKISTDTSLSPDLLKASLSERDDQIRAIETLRTELTGLGKLTSTIASHNSQEDDVQALDRASLLRGIASALASTNQDVLPKADAQPPLSNVVTVIQNAKNSLETHTASLLQTDLLFLHGSWEAATPGSGKRRWTIRCEYNGSEGFATPRVTYSIPTTDHGIVHIDESSCVNSGVLALAASGDEPTLILRAPSSTPTDASAVVFHRMGEKGVKTLWGARGGTSFELDFDNTCKVIKDRPFADLARSGPDLARSLRADLIATVEANLEHFRTDAAAFDKVMEEAIKPLLRIILPVVRDMALEGRSPEVRDAQAIIAGIRHWTTEKSDAGGSPEARVLIRLGLAILADCIDGGACDIRQVAAKVADPSVYYDLGKGGSGDWPTLTPKQQRALVDIVDGLYNAFAPNPDLEDRQRTTAAIRATFDLTALLVELQSTRFDGASEDTAERFEIAVKVVDDLKHLVIAGIDESLSRVAKSATSLLADLIRLAAHDAQSVIPSNVVKGGDDRKSNARELVKTAQKVERVLPWVTTLVAHAEQLKDERSGSLTEAQMKENAEARSKALEDLVDASTRRKQRYGDMVFSLGAGVGFRLAGNFPAGTNVLPIQPVNTVAGDTQGIVQTPLTLPMGFTFQLLPNKGIMRANPKIGSGGKHPSQLEALRDTGTTRTRGIGVGAHLQLSAVDVGQYVILNDEIRGVTWNELLMAGVQVGAILGTPRDNFVIAADYRYVPGVGTQGAHQFGLVTTYYVPFFDFN